MNFSDEIAKLNLPAGSYMIVGSGLLNTLGIRKSNDIDILVSEAVFKLLEEQGWKVETRDDGTKKISFRIYDCMADWYGKSLEEALACAYYVEGIPYLDLQDIYKWKVGMNRLKDIADVKLIEEYLSLRKGTDSYF